MCRLIEVTEGTGAGWVFFYSSNTIPKCQHQQGLFDLEITLRKHEDYSLRPSTKKAHVAAAAADAGCDFGEM